MRRPEAQHELYSFRWRKSKKLSTASAAVEPAEMKRLIVSGIGRNDLTAMTPKSTVGDLYALTDLEPRPKP